MNIAINTRFLLKGKMEGFGWYSYEISKRLVAMHPEHTFYFFFDRPFHPDFVFEKNVVPVVLNPPARHPILFIIWFEWSVRRALKKYAIDLFFSPDGYLSLGSKVPQIGVIHDLNFVHYPQDLPKVASRYLRYFFPKFAKKAVKIITVSEYSKNDIVESYGISPEKVVSIWNGASEVFVPIRDEKKESVRNQYSNGKPYVLFVGALHPRKNVGRLLLAYQEMINAHPEMEIDLVVVGEKLWSNVAFSEKVQMVDRIHFTGRLNLDELALVMASAKVFAYVPYFEGFGIPLVEAMRCGVPILSGNTTCLPEVAGEAAVYCDPFSIQNIRDEMYKLLTNEEDQKRLSIEGLKRSQQFSWDTAAQKVSTVLSEEWKKLQR